VFDPLMRRLNMSGRTLARDLKKAIDSQQIKVELRPIVALEGGRVAAFEAVPSWHHPLQGPLAWPALLEVADRENLAGTLMLSALERSAETLVGWDRTAIEPFIYLAIPGSEPFRSDLVNDVKAIFARIRIEPGALRLGIAERVIADNPEYALQMMRRLREAGAGIGLDRFGRNASWLAYLDRLPLDMIRFDDSLTLPGDKGRPPRILKPLVGLGRELGVALMAGAVANPAAAAELKELGFDLASGPLYGRPMSARDAGALIATQYASAAE
jgi:EAL domain-containing protein (putative c-di-GMP-specific phosphodiesterase class I)